MIAELRLLVGDAAVLDPAPAQYLGDEAEGRGLHGHANAVALPADADEVAAVVRWCYEHDVAIVPRGGGTGYAAGAVPRDGGVVLALDRLDRVRPFEPLLWRMEVEAGVPAAAWVIGVEAVVRARRARLRRRLGAQGRGWLRPAQPARRLRGDARRDHGRLAAADPRPVGRRGPSPVAAFYPDTAAGSAAIERVLGHGLPVAALEFSTRRPCVSPVPVFPASSWTGSSSSRRPPEPPRARLR